MADSLSEAFLKVGKVDVTQVARVELCKKYEASLSRSALAKLACKGNVTEVHEKMAKLYNDRQSRNFFIHILRGFTSDRMVYSLDQWESHHHQTLHCPICGAYMMLWSKLTDISNDIVNRIMIAPTKTDSVTLAKYITEGIKDYNLILASKKSNRAICNFCAKELKPFAVKYAHEHNDGHLYAILREMGVKQTCKNCGQAEKGICIIKRMTGEIAEVKPNDWCENWMYTKKLKQQKRSNCPEGKPGTPGPIGVAVEQSVEVTKVAETILDSINKE